MYTPLMIANAIAEENPVRFDSLQMIKLVQMVQGWGLAVKMDVCVELPVCWQHGPVHVSLRETYRGLHMLDRPIQGPVCPAEGTAVPIVPTSDHRARHLIRRIVELYGDFTGLQMSSIMHAAGTPWHDAYGGRIARRRLFGTPISKDKLRAYYEVVYREAEAEELRRMRIAA
jgi:uncharacterized phage-associated protein